MKNLLTRLFGLIALPFAVLFVLLVFLCDDNKNLD